MTQPILSRRLEVELGARSYPILIEPGLIERAGDLLVPIARSKRVFVIFDEALKGRSLDQLLDALKTVGLKTLRFEVPSGESSKSIQTYDQLMGNLLGERVERGDLVLAFGGGVVGDLAGFVAATCLRGLDFVQIPTTLLSQVDSSVGGKTGINSPFGKNLIGAFYQPKLILIDPLVLKTLSHRELKAGYGEVFKYGCINQADFFDWLEVKGVDVLTGDLSAQVEAIYRSCKAKADIVKADEQETKGLRGLLNLGHTFAHAIETEGAYDGTILHGEAVAVGIAMAFKLSKELGLCHGQDLIRVEQHLQQMDLTRDLSQLKHLNPTFERLSDHMSRDKKVVAGKPRFILVKGIGQAFQSDGVDISKLEPVLRSYL